MIFKYLLLIAIFVSALVFRKKMMEHTIGAISRGFATLSGRVESWAKRQWETNPYSPYARAANFYRFKKYEFRRELYRKWRSTSRAGDKDEENGKNEGSGTGDATSQQRADAPPRQGRETRSPADRGRVFRVRRDRAAQQPEPDAAAPAATSGPVQYLPPGGVAVRERRDESPQQSDVSASELPVRPGPEDSGAALGWQEIPEPRQEGGIVAVYGPREEDLPRLWEPAHYDLPDENGAPGRVFGAWESTPFGPAFRRHDVPESGLYQVVRTGTGKVGSRPLAESGGRLVPQPPRFDDSLSPNAGMFSARRASRGLSYQSGPTVTGAGLPGGPGAEYGGQVAGNAVGRTGASPPQESLQRVQVRETPELRGERQAVLEARQRNFGGGEEKPLSQRPPQAAFKPPKPLGGQAEPFPAGEPLRQTQIRRPPAQQGAPRQQGRESPERTAGDESNGGKEFSAWGFSQQRPQGPAQPETPRAGEAVPLSQRPRQVVFKSPRQPDELASQPIKTKPHVRPREYPSPARGDDVGVEQRKSPPDGERG